MAVRVQAAEVTAEVLTAVAAERVARAEAAVATKEVVPTV